MKVVCPHCTTIVAQLIGKPKKFEAICPKCKATVRIF